VASWLAGETDLTAVAAEERAALERLGVLIAPEQRSTPVAFECALTDRAELAPRPLESSEALIAAPGLWLQRDPEIVPPPLADRVRLDDHHLSGHPREWFLPGRARLWLEDPGTRMLSAFALTSEQEELCAALVPGRRPEIAIDEHTRRALREVGALVPVDYPFARQRVGVGRSGLG
jgi:hypothetical protein